jgi:hypothetical protein
MSAPTINSPLEYFQTDEEDSKAEEKFSALEEEMTGSISTLEEERTGRSRLDEEISTLEEEISARLLKESKAKCSEFDEELLTTTLIESLAFCSEFSSPSGSADEASDRIKNELEDSSFDSKKSSLDDEEIPTKPLSENHADSEFADSEQAEKRLGNRPKAVPTARRGNAFFIYIPFC